MIDIISHYHKYKKTIDKTHKEWEKQHKDRVKEIKREWRNRNYDKVRLNRLKYQNKKLGDQFSEKIYETKDLKALETLLKNEKKRLNIH